jgi:hypothetical protein
MASNGSKPLGGTYWTGDPGDARDMQKGFDSNERIERLLAQTLQRPKAEAKPIAHDSEHDGFRFALPVLQATRTPHA